MESPTPIAVISRPGIGLPEPALTRLTLPTSPAPGMTRVRMLRSQICHSDRRVLAGTKASLVGEQSIVLGHEAIGEVAGGGLVLILPHVGDAHQHLGFHRDGVFADTMDFPDDVLFPLPTPPADREAYLDVMVSAEPLACVLHARRLAPSAVKSVAVLGAGPIGILHALVARDSEVTLVDPSEPRRAMAERLRGLRATVVARAAGKFDRVVVATSRRDAFADAFAASRGDVCLFSGVDGAEPLVVEGCDLERLHRDEGRRMVGGVCAWGSSGYRREDIREAVERLHADFLGERVFAQLATARIDGLGSHRASDLTSRGFDLEFSEPAVVALLRAGAPEHLKLLVRH